jgi:hypothetical protein
MREEAETAFLDAHVEALVNFKNADTRRSRSLQCGSLFAREIDVLRSVRGGNTHLRASRSAGVARKRLD